MTYRERIDLRSRLEREECSLDARCHRTKVTRMWPRSEDVWERVFVGTPEQARQLAELRRQIQVLYQSPAVDVISVSGVRESRWVRWPNWTLRGEGCGVSWVRPHLREVMHEARPHRTPRPRQSKVITLHYVRPLIEGPAPIHTRPPCGHQLFL